MVERRHVRRQPVVVPEDQRLNLLAEAAKQEGDPHTPAEYFFKELKSRTVRAYYTSDIGRMWPVSGRYSPRQRELYGFIVEYHKTLLARIRPGRNRTWSLTHRHTGSGVPQ